ncbi:quinone oxidoreductase family protein [Insolitispirillum peregrinum]|uniref:NADPH2:quinone reductase n=1 Tax=Insolitispirillum peregrinum TaxID=80876 RepID=A0A1N7JEP8_9PROT|nr:quinone oxidoreductase [Insolitispirillum peregrinum]SIS47780.1 NADPH2:quinone reductase [Insolitispirillum peregrinum]
MSTVVRIHQTGGPEVLRVEQIDPGLPGPGEVRLRHTAIGVNFIDTYLRSGLYSLPHLPHGLGFAGAGVVEAVGEGVTGFAVGDRVCYGTGPAGSYATERVMPAAVLIRMPDTLADDIAAGMMLRGMTAQYLIRRLYPVQPGDVVLFHAAAGGVGEIACQWLKALGATVIGTVGSDEKAELARQSGCHHTIVYTRENFKERVKEITNGVGVAVVYDGVGKAVFEDSLDCLRLRGMMCTYGNASGPVPPVSPITLSQKGSLFLTRPTLAHYTSTRAELEATASELLDVVANGTVKVTIGQSYPLTEASRCHQDLEGRKTVGSTVLLP